MKWDENLTEEQRVYASCEIDNHSVLLAGPGTGKTYTIIRKVGYLINEKKINPNHILITTFTRAAATELTNRIKEFIDVDRSLPTISTLHSFALKQLILNQDLLANYQIPVPIRVVDDWEENNLIHEELKEILKCNKNDIRNNFLELSADWDTLKADEDDQSDRSIANFLGTWENHRKIYSYILRSELVYQVKKAIEQISNFKLEKKYKYIVIDEFQDLNRCDLALIHALKNKGSIICGIGDDDQSIYGFRHAYPDEIRKFKSSFTDAKNYGLSICQRCDKKIIRLSKFIANLDKDRIPKKLKPKEGSEEGEIHLYRFDNQYKEAKGIAKLCKKLIEEKSYSVNDILILLRTDRGLKFSSIIKNELEKLKIDVSNQNVDSPFDTIEGRLLLSFLRLINRFNDSLALRTIFKLRKKNKIGPVVISKIYNLALKRNKIFFEIVSEISKNSNLIQYGPRVKTELEDIKEIVNRYKKDFSKLNEADNTINLEILIQQLAAEIISNVINRERLLDSLKVLIQEAKAGNLDTLLKFLNSPLKEMEQEREKDKINIITMHKAKGLTAKAVIIAAAEQEYIPGRQQKEPEKFDELRLLYVSISRAKHFLAITYCNKRLKQQRHTGNHPGEINRHLTEFLRNISLLRVEKGLF